MATLFLEDAGSELTVENHSIVLREKGSICQRIPCRLVDRIVAGGDLAFPSTVIRKLASEGIGIFFPSTRGGASALLWPAGPRSGIRILGQARLYFDLAQRERIARRVVRGKIQGQSSVLRALKDRRPASGFECDKAVRQLSAAIEHLRTGSPSGPAILGIEGASAAAYFHALSSGFPASLGFTSRNRRPPKDPVNALLSLAYTLLYHAALEAILSAGLEPSCGFLHTPDPARAALACDLMEPFRPAVDWEIWKLWQDRTVRVEHFVNSHDSCLLGKAGRRHFYTAFEQALIPLRLRLRHVASAFGRDAETALRSASLSQAEVQP